MEWKYVRKIVQSPLFTVYVLREAETILKRYLLGWKIMLIFVADIVSRPEIYIAGLGIYISRPEMSGNQYRSNN